MSDAKIAVKVIGPTVKAKAIHVTNEAECGWRYGNRKKTFLVKGVVDEVLTPVQVAKERLVSFEPSSSWMKAIKKRLQYALYQ